MDDKVYYVEAVILETKVLKTKNGKDFVACKLVDLQNTQIEASCFDSDLLDKLEDLKVYNFRIEEKGNYKNIVELQDVNDELTNKFLEQISNFQKAEPKPVVKDKSTDDKRELYITLNGKTYVTQAGLLNEAHKKGLKSITTEMLEFRDKELAVVKSTVTMKDNSVYTGYGDATKDNVNSMIVKALLRMAETRATNRALRLATNIGVTSIEELEN